MTVTVKMSVKPVSSGEWTGFRITRPDGAFIRSLTVAANDQGQVRAFSSLNEDGDEALLLDDDVSQPASWLWPLLNGKTSEAVLKALNLQGMPEDVLEAFSQTVAEEVAKLSVDHDAVAILAVSGDPKIAQLEFYSGDTDRANNRKAHAKMFPIFADVLASRVMLKMVVDRRDGSLLDKLAQALSTEEYTISPQHLKRFAQYAAVPEDCSIAHVLRFSSFVQLDWMPKGNAEWEAFCHIATAVCDNIPNAGSFIPAMIKSCGGKWVDLLSKIVKAAYPPPRVEKPKPAPALPSPEGDVPAIQVLDAANTPHQVPAVVVEPPVYVEPPPAARAVRISMSGVRDMIRSFADNVVMPMASHAQSADRVSLSLELRDASEALAAKILFSDRNIFDIADLSRRFHQERYRIEEGSPVLREERKRYIAANVDGGGWPGLTKEVQAPNGLWLVPLKTTPQLKDEGQRVKHCVGGYTAKAERCESHLISVRSLDIATSEVKSLSTCEISGVKGPTGPFREIQHQAYGNTEPTAGAKQAMAWYYGAMQSGEVPVNWDLIKAFKEHNVKNADSVERFCKYNWRDPDLLFEATVPWYPMFAKAYKDLDFAVMVDMPDMQAVSETIPPEMMGLRR